MPSFDEIATFVSEWAGVERSALTEATTLQNDIRLYGDDMFAFILDYSKRFGVDLSGFRWYFHTCEGGYNIGALFFRPPNKRVKNIPITIGMLHEFAQGGRWNIPYPDHSPGRRYDHLVNVIVGFLLFLFFLISLAGAIRGCI